MWQCGVCGTGNTGGEACVRCGATRPPQGPAAEGLGSWPPAAVQPPGTLPADPPVSWPASASADDFGSWSPAGQPPQPSQAPPQSAWAPSGQQWTGAAGPPPQQQPPAAAPQSWAAARPPAQQSWPVSAPPMPPQSWPAAPGPAQVVEPEPRPRPVWIYPAVVGVVLLLALGTGAFVLRDRWLPGGEDNPGTDATTQAAQGTTGPAGPATTPAGPTQPAATTPGAATLPAAVGAVKLDPGLDPRTAPAVAGVFDQYFAAVNQRKADAALAVMDPNGSINQGDAAAVKRFSDGISTSTDDDILLLALGSDPTGKGVLQARVTFRSHQDAGKGPKGRENETCTRWDVTYSVTQPGGQYRIWGSTSAGSRPC